MLTEGFLLDFVRLTPATKKIVKINKQAAGIYEPPSPIKKASTKIICKKQTIKQKH